MGILLDTIMNLNEEYSIYDVADNIRYNGASHRGGHIPAAIKGCINQANIPDNMRLKSFDVYVIDNNTLQVNYITQEPFKSEDADKLIAEIRNAIKNTSEHYNIPVDGTIEIESRDGRDYGYALVDINERMDEEFGTQVDDKEAIKDAKKLAKETDCDLNKEYKELKEGRKAGKDFLFDHLWNRAEGAKLRLGQKQLIKLDSTPGGLWKWEDEADSKAMYAADWAHELQKWFDKDDIELHEDYTPVMDVVVSNIGGELSRQAISSTEELRKYLDSIIDVIEPGDIIKFESGDMEV